MLLRLPSGYLITMISIQKPNSSNQQLKTSIKQIYREDQTHINERMRYILVDWLVEVHLKFKLVQDTL